MKDIVNYQIDENQKAFLDLLLEMDSICAKYEIPYTLGYGTLLGAIRHEGFIPWDNDVDINMTEKDYGRFVEACKKEPDRKTRILCDCRITRGYPKVYGRYYDLTCCRLSDKVNYWENICGRGIDIFYQIAIPKGEKGKDWLDYFYAYDEYVNDVYRHFRMKTDGVMAYYNEALQKEKKQGKEKTLQEMEERIFNQNFEDSEFYIESSARYTSPNPISKIEWFKNPKRVMFEGHMLPVPGDYLEVLRNLYGDDFYMFPAEPKFIEEITYEGIPYEECLSDFLQNVNVEELKRTHKEYKDAAVEEGRRSTEIMRQWYKIYAISLKNHILHKIEEEQISLDQLLINRTAESAAVLDDLFSEYYTRQFDASPLYWRCLFDLGDELLEAALAHLFRFRRDTGKVRKLLRLMEQNEYRLTPKMLEIKDAMDLLWKCRKSFYYGEYEKAQEYGKQYRNIYGEQPELKEIMIQVKYSLSGKSELNDLEKEIVELMDEAPQNPYYRKVYADLQYDRGDISSSSVIYEDLMDSCRDGVLLLDVKHRLRKIQSFQKGE